MSKECRPGLLSTLVSKDFGSSLRNCDNNPPSKFYLGQLVPTFPSQLDGIKGQHDLLKTSLFHKVVRVILKLSFVHDIKAAREEN